MKPSTIEVLKNFASINQGILFLPGKELRTQNVTNTSFATAVLEEPIEREFAIYDLNQFLSALSLFESPDCKYNDDHVLISAGKTRIKYNYSSKAVVKYPDPEKTIKALKEPHTKFTLSKSALDDMLKASAVLKSDLLSVGPKGLRLYRKDNVGSDYTLELADFECGGKTSVMQVEQLKLISRDYNVAINDTAFQFVHKHKELGDILQYTIRQKAD